MNLPRSNHALTVANGGLLVAGGYDGEGVTSRVERLNMNTLTWEETGELPSPRCALSAVSVPVDLFNSNVLNSLRQQCMTAEAFGEDDFGDDATEDSSDEEFLMMDIEED